MKALTGLPAPVLTESQKDAYLVRSQKHELLRPKNETPPALTGRERKEERWDYWECFDETGDGTRLALEYGLRAGPSLTWSNGWDLGKAAHRSAALEHQESYRPRIIVFSPNVWSWKVEDGGTMSLSEQEALQTMALLIQGQINAGNF